MAMKIIEIKKEAEKFILSILNETSPAMLKNGLWWFAEYCCDYMEGEIYSNSKCPWKKLSETEVGDLTSEIVSELWKTHNVDKIIKEYKPISEHK